MPAKVSMTAAKAMRMASVCVSISSPLYSQATAPKRPNELAASDTGDRILNQKQVAEQRR